MGISRQITSIALAIIGLALAGLLITRSQNTAQVVTSVTGGFGNLLATAVGSNASMSVR